MITLFNGTSTVPTSSVFPLSQQHTVYAAGLNPGDVISFEIVVTSPAPGHRPAAPGCCAISSDGSTIEIAGTQTLMCCAGAPVQLTSDNPVVVLDAPQGALIRATYAGVNLGAFSLIAAPSAVTNVSDAMRGCCPPVEEKELLTIRGCDGSILVQGLLEVI